MARASAIPVIASGGVTSLPDLKALQSLRPPLAGVIIGRALYEGSITLPAALQTVVGAPSQQSRSRQEPPGSGSIN